MKKILIVEDEEDIIQNVKSLLELSGYEAVTAASGLEGLRLARNEMPDLILSDIMMPVLDGYRLKKELDADKKTRSIPFVFLTAKADPPEMRFGMNMGADDYLVKPIRAKDLLEAVQARLSRAEQLKSTAEESEPERQFSPEERIFIDQNNRQFFIQIRDISFIEADTAYSNINTADGKKIIIRKLMKEWEKILPPSEFIRIHRSVIVNITCIEKIVKWSNRSYKVYLKNRESPFDVSQRYSAILKNKFSV